MTGSDGLGIYLTQSDYQTSIPHSFPVGDDILRIYVYDTWSGSGNISCRITNMTLGAATLVGQTFGLQLNSSNTYVLFLKNSLEGNARDGKCVVFLKHSLTHTHRDGKCVVFLKHSLTHTYRDGKCVVFLKHSLTHTYRDGKCVVFLKHSLTHTYRDGVSCF